MLAAEMIPRERFGIHDGSPAHALARELFQRFI
jgi:hypothetical protein